jgi:parallel beta-helix repeat protein
VSWRALYFLGVAVSCPTKHTYANSAVHRPLASAGVRIVGNNRSKEALALVGLFFVGLLTSAAGFEGTTLLSTSSGAVIPSDLVPHEAVWIYDAGDLAEWPGSGTQEDPYMIENLLIAEDITCIRIQSTTAYFVIRNCYLTSDSREQSDGVRIYSASNGRVVNCTITGKGYGVYLYSAANCQVENCTIIDNNASGVVVRDSSSCRIISSRILGNGYYGIDADHSSSSQFRSNLIAESGRQGIYLDGGGSHIVENNTIEDSSEEGIWLYYSSGAVANNTVRENGGSGIYAAFSDGSSILHNSLDSNHGYGVYLYYSNGAIVEENNASVNQGSGIYLSRSESCQVTDNTVNGTGIQISGDTVAQWTHTFSDNLVNGRPMEYYQTESDLSIDASLLSQVVLVNCANVDVHSGNFASVCKAVSIAFCHSCNVSSTESNDTYAAVYIYESTDCTIQDNVFTEDGIALIGRDESSWIHTFSNNTLNGLPIGYISGINDAVIEGNQYGQVVLADCDNVTIRNGIYASASLGVAIGFCVDCEVQNCTFDDNYYYGVEVQDSPNLTLHNNTITDTAGTGVVVYASDNLAFSENRILVCGSYGLYINGSDFCNITASNFSSCAYGASIRYLTNTTFMRNSFCGNNYGVYALTVENCSYLNCEFHSNTQYGIWHYTTTDLTIRGSRFHENGGYGAHIRSSNRGEVYSTSFEGNGADGLSLFGADRFLIINNNFTENTAIGLSLDYSSDYNTVYNNTFIDNTGSNAYSYQSTNDFDDGVSIGNYWSDYIGPGTYTVDGYGGAVDNYPRGPTNILDHGPVSYNYGAVGREISWAAYSTIPDTFIVYKDRLVLYSGEWNGSSITVPISGLALGQYNYTLYVNDTLGDYAVDEVIVTVYNNAPTINHPSDRDYHLGVATQPILWDVFDLNPDHYDLYINNELNETATWGGADVSIPIGMLPLGVYNYTLVVYDTLGESAADTVLVEVYDMVPEIFDPPADFSYVEGSTGNFIFWNCSDFNPELYWVYMNGSIYETDVWDDSGITKALTIGIDGLSLGVYNFTLVIQDTSGQTAMDTVFVTVVLPSTTSTTTGTNTGTQAPNILLLTAAAGTAVVAVIVVLVVWRKR